MLVKIYVESASQRWEDVSFLYHSVKRSDVSGNRFEWEPCFIVLASSVTIMEVKAIEFHKIKLNAQIIISMSSLT